MCSHLACMLLLNQKKSVCVCGERPGSGLSWSKRQRISELSSDDKPEQTIHFKNLSHLQMFVIK